MVMLFDCWEGVMEVRYREEIKVYLYPFATDIKAAGNGRQEPTEAASTAWRVHQDAKTRIDVDSPVAACIRYVR